MYAVIESGGKQLTVKTGQSIVVEKLPQKNGDRVSLNNVLMIVSGKESKFGSPFIKGAVVNGKIIKHDKDDKVIVYKMRPKKGTRKKQGHRQWYSKVYIENIELDGKVLESEIRDQKSAAREASEPRPQSGREIRD